jgi:hypothetical protein
MNIKHRIPLPAERSPERSPDASVGERRALELDLHPEISDRSRP